MAIAIIQVAALQIKAKVLSSSTFLFQKFTLPNTHFYNMAGIYLHDLGKAELKDLLSELTGHSNEESVSPYFSPSKYE